MKCYEHEKNIDPTMVVQVTGGQITGSLSSDGIVATYKSVPYAAAPVGALRWQPPQQVEPWDGIRECTQYSKSSVQQVSDLTQPWMATMSQDFLVDEALGFAEDCLYLSIWTKRDSSILKQPVVVYIHGGGFGSGAASVPIYDGESFARKDVVFVGINYRVGMLGFLADPRLDAESKEGISGNYGILDQIAALQWVQDNIDQFGGDPDNVTIVGQSAGGASVDLLTISPYARGLFHNAFSMSFSYVNCMPMITKEEFMARTSNLFLGMTLEQMRNMSADELPNLPFMTTPCIDGKVIPGKMIDVLINGKQNKVNMITGTVTGDFPLFQILTIGNPYMPMTMLDKAEFENAIADKFKDHAMACLEAYPVYGNDAIEKYRELNLDSMVINQYYYAKLRALKSDNATYIYDFNHSMLTGEGVDLGAFHTADVPYWLDNLEMITSERSKYLTQLDNELSKMMSTYLLNFARTGNPNGNGMPVWNKYDETMISSFYIGDNDFAMEGFNGKKVKFWKAYYEELLNL